MNGRQLQSARLAARIEKLNSRLKFDCYEIASALIQMRTGGRELSDSELLQALKEYELESPRSFYSPEFIDAGFSIPQRAKPLKPRRGKPRHPLRGPLKRA